MSSHIQPGYSQESIDPQIWRFRWFLVYLYAIALILSIIAAVVIAIGTRSVYPGAIPAPLLLAMRPIVKWAFSQPSEEIQHPDPIELNPIRQRRRQGVQ